MTRNGHRFRGPCLSVCAVLLLAASALPASAASDDQNPNAPSIRPPSADFMLGRPRVTRRRERQLGVRQCRQRPLRLRHRSVDDRPRCVQPAGLRRRTCRSTWRRASMSRWGSKAAGWSKRSEYRDFVDNKLLPIEQTTSLKEQVFSAGVKFALLPAGRRVSRFAWIPSKFTPYVGAGGGMLRYDFEQFGDFVDFADNHVFNSDFRSAGWTPSVFASGGADVHLFKRVFMSLEGRYTWSSATLDTDFVDFDPIDLKGFRFGAGLPLRLLGLSTERTIYEHHISSSDDDGGGISRRRRSRAAHRRRRRRPRPRPTRGSRIGSAAGASKTTWSARARGSASRPTISNGVKLQTLVGTQRGADEVIVPDGVARPISDPDCKGTERAEWSSDGAARVPLHRCHLRQGAGAQSLERRVPDRGHGLGQRAVGGWRSDQERARAAVSPRDRPEAGRRDRSAAAVGADAGGRAARGRHRLERRRRDRGQRQAAGRCRAGGDHRRPRSLRVEQEEPRRDEQGERARNGDRPDDRAHLSAALRRAARRRRARMRRRGFRWAAAGTTRS